MKRRGEEMFVITKEQRELAERIAFLENEITKVTYCLETADIVLESYFQTGLRYNELTSQLRFHLRKLNEEIAER